MKKREPGSWSLKFSGEITEIEVQMPDRIIYTRIVNRKSKAQKKRQTKRGRK